MKLEEEILISAYLDGELAGDEEQRAQKLLAASGEARQLADEMRSVRSRLQSLPRLGLPADFAAQTVRRAEQELAAANAVDAAVGGSPAPTRSLGESSIRTAGGSTWASWRTYAWAAVALAAGVMIMLNSRLAEEQIQTAQKPQATDKRPSDVLVKSTGGSEGASSPAPGQSNNLATDQATPHASSPSDDLQPPLSRTGQAPKFGSGLDSINLDGASTRNESLPIDELDFGNGGYVFVTLDVTPEAAQGREFKQLLENRHITISEATAKGSGARAKPDQGAAPAVNKHLQEWVPEGDSAGKSDAFYLVEVSPEQLRAALDDLAASGEWCSEVAVSTQAVVKKTRKQAADAPRPEEPKKTDESNQEKEIATDKPQPAPNATPAPGPPPAPAPTPEPKLPPGANENDAARELLNPKPSERETATDGKLPPAPKADPEVRSDREKVQVAPEPKPVPRRSTTRRTAEPPVGEVSGPPAIAKTATPLRAIFVLRIKEASPAAAAPVAPAAPQ